MLQQATQYTYIFFLLLITFLSSCYSNSGTTVGDYTFPTATNGYTYNENTWENPNGGLMGGYYDIEWSAEELPDSADVGDILSLIGQIVNHGPDTYAGSLELTYMVVDSLSENLPTSSPYASFWEDDFNEEDSLDVDEIVEISDNQSLVVTEDNFRKGQKNIIIIWPVDLINDTNPNNNYYIKEIYVRD